MNGEILRGFTDAIILNILLESDSYGYKISRSIIEKTNNKKGDKHRYNAYLLSHNNLVR